MKPISRWMAALAWVVAMGGVAMAAETDEQRAAAAREKDPAWKPACVEVGVIRVGDGKLPGVLQNFCLDGQGNILACYVPRVTQIGVSADPKSLASIRVYSPKGELLRTLPLEIKPVAIAVAKDGAIFVAGDGKLLKLDGAGKVLASAASPIAAVEVVITPEIEQMLLQTKRPIEEEKAKMKATFEQRRSEISGVAVSDRDVFLAVPTPNDFTYRVYRFDHALSEPKLVVEKLRGCCGLMDIATHGDKLWVAHNARHTVESRDRDGATLTKFGTKGTVKAADFGGCCEPKNVRVLPNGDILAGESEPHPCIKRYSASGEFLGVVAEFRKEKPECLRVTVEASADGSRYYLLDLKNDSIRVFGEKK